MYKEKPGWQRGWFAQHQRLLQAIASQKKRASVVVQGDFHASAVGKILRSGEIAMAQPVHIVQSGTLGTGDLTFPSSVRNIQPGASELVQIDETLKPTEKNGFTVIDVTREKMTFTHFMWCPPQQFHGEPAREGGAAADPAPARRTVLRRAAGRRPRLGHPVHHHVPLAEVKCRAPRHGSDLPRARRPARRRPGGGSGTW